MNIGKLKSLHAVWGKHRFVVNDMTAGADYFELFVEIKPTPKDSSVALRATLEDFVRDEHWDERMSVAYSFKQRLEFLASKLFEKGYHVLQVGIENKETKTGECVYFLEDENVKIQ